MNTKAKLVRQISAVAFTDAIDLMACLGCCEKANLSGWRMLFRRPTPLAQQP
jgi:hypothetical protein